MQEKNYFKMISITQNTLYTYGNTDQRFKMPLHQNPSPSHLHIVYYVKFKLKTKICYLIEPLISLYLFLDVK